MPRLLLLVVLVLLPALAATAGDLTVGWIQRLPVIDYVWDSASPDREGWPVDGEIVTWRAEVRNWLDEPATIRFTWRLDGEVVVEGDLNLEAGAHAFVDHQMPWSFERRRLSISIDTTNAVDEESEVNNTLEIFTDAITIAFYVEQRAYDFFRETQHKLGIGSTSFENWAQRHVDMYNESAALAAAYPETPDGVLDRFRLDRIHVVPDGALPLVPLPNEGEMGGEPNQSTHPNTDDRSVDMLWGLPSSVADVVDDSEPPHPHHRAYVSAVVLHELGHARYLPDVYGWDVWASGPGAVDIQEPPSGGVRVAGSAYMPTIPGSSGRVFLTPEAGLMSDESSYFDRYSAILLNRISGHRATRGNYNEPENINEYLHDLPAENTLVLRDAAGNILSNATVQIFQAAGERNFWYWKRYDSTPDVTLTSNAEGEVEVGRNPFASDGNIVHTWRRSNIVAIVRVKPQGRDALYGFLESRIFNLAYWRGDVEHARHEIVVGPRPCGRPEPELLSPSYLGRTDPRFTLEWSAVPGATGYEVWVSEDLAKPRVVAETAETSLSHAGQGTIYWWVVARFDGCPSTRSITGKFTTALQERRRGVRR